MAITYNTNIPPDGNPDGLVDAPTNALFYKNNTFYKINNSGSCATTWVDVYFNAFNVPNYYRTNSDNQLLQYNTGSYLYVKTSIAGTPYGWVLLSASSPFIQT